MYVCICHGHRERDIREAAKSGLRRARDVYRHLGKPPQCGRCLEVAARVIDEVHGVAAAKSEPLANAS
jgi:bacterioferritin-associated ferredoxin